ncbi:acyl carrier protein [Acidovorax carolinensis]|uniref:acyl carrier protein n=1 Tax=Acidovorax carolinensis TaxID=553814 RepID=UPI000B3448FE|nr:acyl carrier protein [Acidovorax carolinensis]ART49629.1 acyl carrier protein [Acidovorax carolinensis]
MNLTEQVLHVLDSALRLQGRTTEFTRDTPLLGALPELDSMAVLALLTGLENHFGITFNDEDVNGSAFASVGSLSDLVEQALARQDP